MEDASAADNAIFKRAPIVNAKQDEARATCAGGPESTTDGR